MCNTPAVESEMPPIGLGTRPLHSHIPSTHQRLPNIVNTVKHVRHLRVEQDLLDLLGVISIDRTPQKEEMRSNGRQAVELVEEGDVVNAARSAFLSWWQMERSWIIYNDKSVSDLKTMSTVEVATMRQMLTGIISCHAASFSCVEGPAKRSSCLKVTNSLGTAQEISNVIGVLRPKRRLTWRNRRQQQSLTLINSDRVVQCSSKDQAHCSENNNGDEQTSIESCVGADKCFRSCCEVLGLLIILFL
jgi:hypothetical protein